MWLRCNRCFKYAVWLLLLFAVLYVWSSFFLAKVIPAQRAGIEYWLSQRLATQVKIGSIEVNGHLLAPNIVLRDIRVMSVNPQRAPLTMKLGWMGVDGWASLWHQQLRLRFLQLKGLHVQGWQTDQGEWRVGGFEALQKTFSQSSFQSLSANTSSANAPTVNPPTARVASLHQTLLGLDALIAQRGLLLEDINLQLVPNELVPNQQLPVDPPAQWLTWLYGDTNRYAPLLTQNLWMQRLSLHKHHKHYQLFSQITLLKNDPLHLTLSARIQGQSLAPESWQAQAYLKLDNTDIKPWVSGYLPANVTLDALQGQAEMWLSLQAGRLQRLHTRIALEQARWRYQWRGYRLDHVEAAFDFQYDHRKQWQLEGHPSIWQVGSQRWTLPAWFLHQQSPADQAASRHFQIAEVEVAALHQLINAVAQFDSNSPVPPVVSLLSPHQTPWKQPRTVEYWLTQLQHHAPRGWLRDGRWWQTSTEQNWRFNLTGGALNAHSYWPGFSGLNAQVQSKLTQASQSQASQGEGQASQSQNKTSQIDIQIDSPALAFDWPKVFRQGLPAARLQAQASLTIQPKQWQLQVNQFEALNADALANGHAVLTQYANEAPLLKLQAQMRQVNALAASVYLPAKVMPPTVVNWLEKAVLAGDIQQGDFLYQGRLQMYAGPLANHLSMRFQFANATIDYLPPWPALEQAQGQVDVANKKIQVNLQQAKVLGAEVLPSQLTIAPVDQQLRLQLQADVNSDVKTGLMLLAQSPLQAKLSALLTALSGQGPIKVHLQLDAPLAATPPDVKPRPLWANVRTQFDNATLEWPLLKLTAQKFNGELTYDTLTGVTMPSWRASWFDQPLQGRTYTQAPATQTSSTQTSSAQASSAQASNQKPRAIVTEFTGSMPLKPFNEWLQQPLLAYASGKPTFAAKLVLTPWHNMRGAFLQVDSDLNGVTVDLPAPFGLNGKQTLGLRYRQQLDPQRPMIELRYGLGLRVRKRNEAVGIYFGDARLDDNRAELRVANLPAGITVMGRLPAIDVQQWSQVLSERGSERKKSSVNATAATAQPLTAWSDALLSLRALDVSLADLRWQDKTLGNTQLSLTPRQQDWLLKINSTNADLEAEVPLAFIRHWADQGFTSLTRLNADQAIQLRIARLRWPLSTSIEGVKPLSPLAPVKTTLPPPLSPAPPFAPDAFPAMQLTIAQLLQQEKNIGSLQTRIQPSSTGLSFDNLQANLKQVSVQGKGQWRWLPTQAVPNSVQLSQSSQFVGQLATDNMLAFLQAWRYPPIMDAKTARLNVDLTWPGNLSDFALPRLQGKLSLKMSNGRLLNVDNTTASVRVAGILNFETIIRRMQLDFSDLFKKGLAFDDINSTFVLANQQMHTDDFVLKGPAATFKVSGHADLLRQQLDHRLIVTLPVSRNLVLPAAATGGLPAAATAFLIEQAIGDRLDKLTELTFTLQGSWQDPKIEKR